VRERKEGNQERQIDEEGAEWGGFERRTRERETARKKKRQRERQM